MMQSATPAYTPALGHAALTPFYDAAIALMTRERVWRAALLRQVAPRDGELIADIGCGTGVFALMMKRAAPDTQIVGIDPDPSVLARAARRAEASRCAIEFKQGFARDAASLLNRPVDKIVSSLVFHQTPLAEKRAGLAAMRAALRPGGAAHIADYGLQRTPLMRALFTQVQRLDGFENTTPNAEGVLPELMREAGFVDVAETRIIATPTGSISLYIGLAGGRAS